MYPLGALTLAELVWAVQEDWLDGELDNDEEPFARLAREAQRLLEETQMWAEGLGEGEE